jgi:hypothetical protein
LKQRKRTLSAGRGSCAKHCRRAAMGSGHTDVVKHSCSSASSAGHLGFPVLTTINNAKKKIIIIISFCLVDWPSSVELRVGE